MTLESQPKGWVPWRSKGVRSCDVASELSHGLGAFCPTTRQGSLSAFRETSVAQLPKLHEQRPDLCFLSRPAAMAYWFDTGRRAIFENLVDVFDKIDDGLKAGTSRHRFHA